MENLIAFVGMWVGGFMLGFGLGSKFGETKERKEWNELIKHGIIPKPPKPKK